MILTPQLAAIISFAAGALIFFAIGFFIARVGAAPESPPSKTDDGPAAAAADKLAKLSHQRDLAMGRYRSLKAYTVSQKVKTRARFAAAGERIAALRRELDAAHAAVGDLKEQTETYALELKRTEARAVALQEEKTSATQSLEKVTWELQGASQRLKALAGLEDEHRTLLGKLESFESRKEDVEALRDENRWLKSQLAESDVLKDKLDALKIENACLNAMGMILEKPLSQSVPAPLEGLGRSFQHLANQLSQIDGSRGVVLADDLGLLIAGTGDHMEAMAGLAAVFSDVCLRIGSMLPFGEIDAMKITNRQNLTIAMQPFDIASVNVIITTLSVGPEPDRGQIDTLIEQATAS